MQAPRSGASVLSRPAAVSQRRPGHPRADAPIQAPVAKCYAERWVGSVRRRRAGGRRGIGKMSRQAWRRVARVVAPAERCLIRAVMPRMPRVTGAEVLGLCARWVGWSSRSKARTFISSTLICDVGSRFTQERPSQGTNNCKTKLNLASVQPASSFHEGGTRGSRRRAEEGRQTQRI